MALSRSCLLVLVLLLLGSAGCSRVTFGYNHADWLLRYWINGYTSFNAEQKTVIRLEVAGYMRWHRQTALPEYIALLQQLQALIERDAALTAADVIRFRTQSARVYRMTMTPFVRPAARVLGTLDRSQIEELRARLAERNREQREELLSDSAQEDLARRAERHVDNVAGLVGRLSREQKERITALSLRIPFASDHYLAQREAKQASLIALLDGGAGEDAIAALLQQWIDFPEVSRSAQQQLAITAYESAMNEMTAAIFELLTPRQKERLRGKVAAWVGDFRQLHAAAPDAAPEAADCAPPLTVAGDCRDALPAIR
jgi:hypothetical protein